MARPKLLSVLLLLWVVAAVGGGVWRIFVLGQQIENGGPQALTADGHGGFILATNDELLHFGPDQKLLDRHTAGSLGLGNINSVTQQGESTLWVYDTDARRPYRCDENSWQCAPFGPADLRLGRCIVIAIDPGPDHHVLISDNGNDRILTLDSSGQLLKKADAWWVPNQLSASDDGFVLADTGHYQLVQFRDPGEKGQPLFGTHGQPYRFARRGSDWWVVESGSSLNDGWVQYYDRREHSSRKLKLGVRDAIAVADSGSAIIVASKADWRLLALDPASNAVTPVADAGIQREFAQRAAARTAAEKQRSFLPGLMIAAVLPALLGGVVLQKRMDAAKGSTPAPRISTQAIPPQSMPAPPPRPAGSEPPVSATRRPLANGAIKLLPDAQGFRDYRARLKRVAPVLALPLLPLFALFLSLPAALAGTRLLFLASLLLAPMVALVLLGWLQDMRLARIYRSLYLVCDKDRLYLYEDGKPVLITPYDTVFISRRELVIGDRRLPWRAWLKNVGGRGPLYFPVWAAADIEQVLVPRLPAANSGGSAFGLALAVARLNPLLSLRLFWAELLSLVLVVLVYGGWLFQNGHRFFFLH